MKSKFFSILLTFVLSLSMSISAFANSPNNYDQEVVNDLQKAKATNFTVENDIIDILSVTRDSNSAVPFGIDPGVGATRVNLVTYGSYAELAVQDTSSGIFDTIKNNAMWIIGNFVKGTVGIVVYNVVDLLVDNIEVSKMATAKTMVGYTYPTKQGQVWYNNVWNTLFESTNRNTYKYYYALYWNKDKVQRQGTKDFTPDKGYSAARVEKAPHYDDNTYIQDQASKNYIQGKKYTTEEWYN
ncbi:hypothetical protein [Paenibacillus aceti]|uniref:Bacterial toxin 44 domain-containing protein n=1 Tax=Paenibacillus aceti TaxID=1820010 RepID=A0ABQ1W8J5_9BACL|nr:hypothetical protein [Paenibacillus aceti]GGG16530.1 hypothetical protein GCM10010913_43200 [Paenibacillus aceti]